MKRRRFGARVRSRRKWRSVVGVLRELEESCETPVGRLRQVVDAMAVEMHAGLASEGGSKLKSCSLLLTIYLLGCIGILIFHHVVRSEVGTYYALDLGGTNLRVVRVQLGGRSSSILSKDVELLPIPQHLMTSTSEVGREVVECLQAGLARNGLDMQVAVLVNDTVGTLALGHYHDADTVAAVIIGTGTNASYLERSDAIIKCQGLLTTSGGMVVNMEWGNFWSSHLPRTSYDIDLDGESPNPNDQGFEKMISGLYLGDIVRRVILRMSQESDIFGPLSPSLLVPFILHTPFVSKMHEDDSPDLQEVARILKEKLEIPEVPLKVRKLVVRICDVVTRRAARLAAAGIVGILKKIGRDGTGGISSIRGRSDIKMRRTVVAIEGVYILAIQCSGSTCTKP
ncbi:hypothetical protein GH714_028053 [Hevea brasiliensis]|uniref:Phosphotransferase n=1 Tax=Hevea brasiliensis TaxID=3981 RepID=A0A6A6MEH4_HEVBR|nr:hypothetical protein GH714_028053 [Hevea brasiliensis]